MKRIVLLAIVVIGCVAAWRLGSRLSADAVGMAVGILLGVLASIPTSLLILANSRRREGRDDEQWERVAPERTPPIYQPPVIVLTGHAPPMQPPMITPSSSAGQPIEAWPQRASARQFKIVGEVERWAE
jgi:hypothetical protein